MDKLPDELIVRIGEHLDAGRHHAMHRGAYQRGLASLARTSKRFHRLLLPLLYQQPLLLNRNQAATWTRTYSSLIDPFKRAKAGRVWPPKVLKPEGLICDSWFSFSLPTVSNALNELAVFATLTSLSLRRIRLDTNFLPLLLSPGSSCRQVLKLLDIEHCLEVTPSKDYKRALAFILEAFTLLEDIWKDTDSEALMNVTNARIGIEIPEGESASDYEDFDEEYETIQAAHSDYRLFTQVWEGKAPPGVPELPYYYDCHAFESLTSFTLQIANSEQLYLIIYTSNFPALRRLILATAEEIRIEFDLMDLKTFRMSITRNDPKAKPGLLYLPSWWGDVTLDLISENVEALFLVEGEPVPPLTKDEVEQFDSRPYGGPKLDLLDLRKAEMVILLPPE